MTVCGFFIFFFYLFIRGNRGDERVEGNGWGKGDKNEEGRRGQQRLSREREAERGRGSSTSQEFSLNPMKMRRAFGKMILDER